MSDDFEAYVVRELVRYDTNEEYGIEVLGKLMDRLTAARKENARLRALLDDAHGCVVDGSWCSCDDSPSVPCEMALALRAEP